MSRRLISAEEMYEDLCEHIEEVFGGLLKSDPGNLDPHYMLNMIFKQAKHDKEYVDRVVEQAKENINYNFETIGMILKAASDSEKDKP
jgi:hypothetical protein